MQDTDPRVGNAPQNWYPGGKLKYRGGIWLLFEKKRSPRRGNQRNQWCRAERWWGEHDPGGKTPMITVLAGLDSDHFECTVEPGYAGPCERFAANNERTKRQNWRPSPPAPRARPGRRPRLGGKKNKRRRKRLGGRKSYNRTASRYVVDLPLWCTFSRQ